MDYSSYLHQVSTPRPSSSRKLLGLSKTLSKTTLLDDSSSENDEKEKVVVYHNDDDDDEAIQDMMRDLSMVGAKSHEAHHPDSSGTSLVSYDDDDDDTTIFLCHDGSSSSVEEASLFSMDSDLDHRLEDIYADFCSTMGTSYNTHTSNFTDISFDETGSFLGVDKTKSQATHRLFDPEASKTTITSINEQEQSEQQDNDDDDDALLAPPTMRRAVSNNNAATLVSAIRQQRVAQLTRSRSPGTWVPVVAPPFLRVPRVVANAWTPSKATRRWGVYPHGRCS